MVGNPHVHEDAVLMNEYNRGYGAGYHRNKQALADVSAEMSKFELFMRGYMQGIEDRIEDEEAISTGVFDHLSEGERRFLYGDEVDHV